MSEPAFDIAVMSAADLDRAVAWAAEEGWDPGLYDAALFRIADPTGFLVGRVDGTPAVSISVVRYDGDFGFLGFYIARPPHRGQGFGIRVWEAGMAYLAGAVVGLDGVIAQQANYVRSGFRLAHRNIRFGGRSGGTGAPPAGVALVPLEEVPLDRLLAFDRRHFPAPRRAFLAAWVAQPGGHGLAAIRDGAVAGMAVARPTAGGWKIGPLFAAGEAVAEALFGALVARTGDRPVYLDVPECNAAAVRLAERHGLVPAFETARMYRGPTPLVDLDQTFGITTFELG